MFGRAYMYIEFVFHLNICGCGCGQNPVVLSETLEHILYPSYNGFNAPSKVIERSKYFQITDFIYIAYNYDI